ncbi:hypothetical protein [Labrys wisconsinensis]|uniref:Uncharacterized protein n=1 Tax=Labrys wisconsinensis TaxID=425677 RepID=A0ABU0JCE5_9HYPH|nr:hypothetical protein [Labrys wisconsinensis]MDQ0471951.1 hypothetical protein [Labrys wisconsinensis]
MERSAQYRRFAADCLRLARIAGTEKERLLMVAMASGWLDLAERSEGAPASEEPLRKARRAPAPAGGRTRH